MSLVCQRSLPTHAPPWVHCSCNLRKADCGGGPRGSASSFTIGSKGYVGIGGNNGIEKKDFWEFDPVGNTWTQKADFGGTAREQATQFAIGIKGYIGTGYDGSTWTSDFWEYDPSSNTWTQKAEFGGTARYDGIGFSVGGKGYIGTGYNGTYLNDFWEYSPDGGSDLTLTSAASRKTHGAKGAFDISLPLSGNVGIECRTGLTRNVVVMTFNNNVTGADSASSSGGTVGSVSVDPADAHNLLVTFNGAACNGSTVTVTANNVHCDQGNTLSSASASMGILVGDVTGDGRVTNGDTAAVRAVQGQQTNASNFRDDVTLDGKINTQDVQTVRSHRGDVLP